MIVALVSKKGGVGKTTTAVNLAAALAAMGRRVLLVDLDAQCSASLSLGLNREQFIPSSADVVLGNTAIEAAIKRTEVAGLDLVPGSTDLVSADHSLASYRGRERTLQSKLERAKEIYDFILLDCPPSLSLLPTSALVASDGFIIPATPHFLAIEGVGNLMTAAKRIAHANATRTELLGVLMTMVDYRTRLTRANVTKLREAFGRDVFAIEIRVNVRLAEAPGYGHTIFQHDANSTGAKAYRLLAEELLLRTERLEGASPMAKVYRWPTPIRAIS